MKAAGLILIVTTVFYSACQPKFTRKWELQYEIVRLSNEPVTYRVFYRTDDGTTKNVGPIMDSVWQSEVFESVPNSQEVSLEINVILGLGDLELKVLRDGAVHKSEVMVSPQREHIVETAL